MNSYDASRSVILFITLFLEKFKRFWVRARFLKSARGEDSTAIELCWMEAHVVHAFLFHLLTYLSYALMVVADGRYAALM